MLLGPKSHSELESYGFKLRGLPGKYTKYYLGKLNEIFIGYVAIDLLPSTDVMPIYELFVHPEVRGKGYGSQLILGAEELGRLNKYKKTVVNPEPLPNSVTKEELVNWYSHRGYQSLANGEMEKCLHD